MSDGEDERTLVQKITKLETYMDMLLKDREKIQENSDNQIATSKDIAQIKKEQVKLWDIHDEFKEERIKVENRCQNESERLERIESEQKRLWKFYRSVKKDIKSEVKKFNAWKTLIMKDFPAMRDDYRDLKKLLWRFGIAIVAIGALTALGVTFGLQYLPF